MEPEKSLTTVLGWDTHLPLDFHFKIEGYYKYIFDRLYVNLEEDSGSEALNPLIKTDGIGHVVGGDLLLERKTSRYFDGMLSYSFVYGKYYNPDTGENEFANDDDPRGEWYFPAFHRFHNLNLLLNIKPLKWFTFMSKLSFATGTPRKDWEDEKSMYPAMVEGELAEFYNRGSIYSSTLRMNWVLALDLKLSFHSFKPNSKIEWEFYIGIENVLAPLMSAILPSDSVDLDKWNGEEKDVPAAGLNFPTPSIGFKLSY